MRSSRQTLIPDIQGSTIGSLDAAGTLTRTGYQPFGENPGLAGGSFQYTAARFDPETAGSASQPSGLYYMRSRMYCPSWGRFCQPDTIGYAGGNNLYAYVGNDPLNKTDPGGKCFGPLVVVCVVEAAEGVEALAVIIESAETAEAGAAVVEGGIATGTAVTTSTVEAGGTATAAAAGEQTFTISNGLPTATTTQVGIPETPVWLRPSGMVGLDEPALDIGATTNAVKTATIVGGVLVVGETLYYGESPEDVANPGESAAFGLANQLGGSTPSSDGASQAPK